MVSVPRPERPQAREAADTALACLAEALADLMAHRLITASQCPPHDGGEPKPRQDGEKRPQARGSES